MYSLSAGSEDKAAEAEPGHKVGVLSASDIRGFV